MQMVSEVRKDLLKAVSSPEMGLLEATDRIAAAAPNLQDWELETVFGLARWRFTKGVYTLSKAIEELILDSQAENIPREVLRHLPEWSVYIQVEAVRGLRGFFFTFSEEEEGDSLQFLLAWEDRNQVFSMALEDNLEKSLEKSLLYLKTRRERREALDLLSRLLNLVLYLCTRNAEYGGERPSRPMPKKIKKGEKYVIPAQPKNWDVEFRVGPKLERNPQHPSRVEGSTTGARKRSHSRRSHFRWQACGKGWKDHELIWINTQRINPGLSGQQPAVRRDIPPQ